MQSLVCDISARLSVCAWPSFGSCWCNSRPHSQRGQADTRCASSWINLAMTFKGPVSLASQFILAGTGQSKGWGIGKLGKNKFKRAKCFTMAICIRDTDWLSLIKHTTRRTQKVRVCVTHTQVRACLRVEGKYSHYRSHRKNCMYLNLRTLLWGVRLYRSVCICACVCVFILATNNQGIFGTRWEGTFSIWIYKEREQ